ncbi:beta-ketoacyl synthase N-terminal-like domain-containing protein [Streptomyces geranii]|uniref:beta-ketoacyl synthase N-terminal-like domain-containing protein n=1 Tax=Streptomyces geranii TaxID=2058923 RepID=UPI000D02E85E|nr:beta-ketoacyl synthase N-terminal-like domain-containing protein [Streptomyces geranii]
MNPDSRIWVTGMAWTTALGSALDPVWELLLDGASGIGDVVSPMPLRSTRAAVVPGVPQDAPASHRQHELTRTTLSEALADAGIEPDDPALVPVLGTSYGAHLDLAETASLSQWSAAAVRGAGLTAEPVTVTTACSAGSDAILTGLALLREGAAELCVCGGADVLTLGKRLGHSRLGTMSPVALRAFDTRHDGTVLGEGAAFLVLEPEERARARGARPHGILAGAASSNDAASAVAPDPSGANVVLAVERALRTARITPADVSVVNAHGSGTPVNDTVEARAYTHLFAESPTPPVVFATKGAFGHTLGATGAIEAVAVLQALATSTAPPVHGLREPIPQLGLPVAARQPMKVDQGYGISVTLGFGGFNTCLVLQGPGSTTP